MNTDGEEGPCNRSRRLGDFQLLFQIASPSHNNTLLGISFLETRCPYSDYLATLCETRMLVFLSHSAAYWRRVSCRMVLSRENSFNNIFTRNFASMSQKKYIVGKL